MALNIDNPNEYHLIVSKIQIKKNKFLEILKNQQNICDINKYLFLMFNDMNKIFETNEHLMDKFWVNNSDNYQMCKIIVPEKSETKLIESNENKLSHNFFEN